MKSIFKALFELLRKFAPILIAILVVLLLVWLTMCSNIIGGDDPIEAPVEQAEPTEFELPEPTEEPGE